MAPFTKSEENTFCRFIYRIDSVKTTKKNEIVVWNHELVDEKNSCSSSFTGRAENYYCFLSNLSWLNSEKSEDFVVKDFLNRKIEKLQTGKMRFE